jgi:hypothetical protein
VYISIYIHTCMCAYGIYIFMCVISLYIYNIHVSIDNIITYLRMERTGLKATISPGQTRTPGTRGPQYVLRVPVAGGLRYLWTGQWAWGYWPTNTYPQWRIELWISYDKLLLV